MRAWSFRLCLASVVVAAVLHPSAPALAQNTPAPPEPSITGNPQAPTFRAGVNVITVDAAAVDGRGRPVLDLRAPDFSVRIDGQPRRIVSVEAVRMESAPPRPGTTQPAIESFFTTNQHAPTSRLIVLAVDQLNILPGDARQLLQSASRFLDALGPEDRVAFFAFPAPGIAIDFTTDRVRIRRAMELTVGGAQRFEGKFNVGLYEAIQAMLKSDEVMMAKVIARECRRAVGPALDECTRQLTSEMAQMVSRVREDRLRSLDGLEAILDGLALVDAPKALVVMSEGLVLDNPTDVDGVVRAASRAQASINVLLMDVPRGSDLARGPIMPPTLTEDRDLQINGLRELAAASRGSLYNIAGNGAPIFDRLASELSAYYLIGVEEEDGDRNDRPHRIDVEIKRQGITVRSRRAFVLSAPKRLTPAETLSAVLRAPFGVADIPLRATTFSVQDPASSRVRLLIAADVGQPGSPAARYSVAWTLIDREGRVAASGAESRTLTPRQAGGTDTLGFGTELLVEPGVYSLRLAVLDGEGRRGAITREVNAWKMAGEEFAVGDLLIGPAPAPGESLATGVEPQVAGDIAGTVELHATAATTFDATRVTFEVAETEESPALLTVPASLVAGPTPGSRAAGTALPAARLPAGRYVVRARVTRNGALAGVLVRPFIVSAPTAGAPTVKATLTTSLPIPRFNRADTLTPELIAEMLRTVEQRSPGLKAAVAEARAGRYAAGALEALGEGQQDVAAFLKGLDFYVKGQFDQAATQLNVAAGPRREFFPGAFFLGASLAAVGRDRDAAATWQLGFGSQTRPPIAYVLFADARLRDGQPQSVVDVLQQAWERLPSDDGLASRLATSLVLTEQFDKALPVLEGYLTTSRRSGCTALCHSCAIRSQHTKPPASLGR